MGEGLVLWRRLERAERAAGPLQQREQCCRGRRPSPARRRPNTAAPGERAASMSALPSRVPLVVRGAGRPAVCPVSRRVTAVLPALRWRLRTVAVVSRVSGARARPGLLPPPPVPGPARAFSQRLAEREFLLEAAAHRPDCRSSVSPRTKRAAATRSRARASRLRLPARVPAEGRDDSVADPEGVGARLELPAGLGAVAEDRQLARTSAALRAVVGSTTLMIAVARVRDGAALAQHRPADPVEDDLLALPADDADPPVLRQEGDVTPARSLPALSTTPQSTKVSPAACPDPQRTLGRRAGVWPRRA